MSESGTGPQDDHAQKEWFNTASIADGNGGALQMALQIALHFALQFGKGTIGSITGCERRAWPCGDALQFTPGSKLANPFCQAASSLAP